MAQRACAGGAGRYAVVRVYVGEFGEKIFDVTVATPTVASKPTKVIQTYSGKVVVNYGSYATSGTATLQQKSSTGTWTSVTKVKLTHGTATMSFKPGATHTYRVAVKPKGLSTKYTSTFSVKYVPLLTVTAPASAKKNATVTFTLTQYLAPPYYAKLQKLSGSTWVTVKTFVVGNTVEKVTAKLTSTSKWRVTAGRLHVEDDHCDGQVAACAGTTMGAMHGEYKVPGGKLVAVDVELDTAHEALASVVVSGDFFLEPAEAILEVNRALTGAPASASVAALTALVANALVRRGARGFQRRRGGDRRAARAWPRHRLA